MMDFDVLRDRVLAVDGIFEFQEDAIKEAHQHIQESFNASIPSDLGKAGASEPSCGYIFAHGDVIYRCKTCTHDETCCLCAKCFQDVDHEGHEVSYTISKGSGGSCDCGEDESWRIPLSCPAHQKHPSDEQTRLLPSVSETIRKLFTELLDRIIEPVSRNSFRAALGPEDISEEPVVALVLFNDEKHSYDDVIQVLGISGLMGKRTAEHFARTIDNHVPETRLAATNLIGNRCTEYRAGV